MFVPLILKENLRYVIPFSAANGECDVRKRAYTVCLEDYIRIAVVLTIVGWIVWGRPHLFGKQSHCLSYKTICFLCAYISILHVSVSLEQLPVALCRGQCNNIVGGHRSFNP